MKIEPKTAVNSWNNISIAYLILFVSAALDNARGPILPILAREFSIPYARVSGLLVAGYVGGFLGTVVAQRWLQQRRDRLVAVVGCVVAAASCAGAQCVHDVPSLLVFGAAVGSALGILGMTCNVLAVSGSAVESRGRILSGLHVMYGAGSFIAPLGIAQFVAAGKGWVGALAALGVVTALIAVAAALLLRNGIVSREVVIVAEKRPGLESEAHAAVGGTVPTRTHWLGGSTLALILFILYVAAEVLTSMWMVTFLVDGRGRDLASASGTLAAFFGVMALTRMLTSLTYSPRFERPVLILSLVVPAAVLAACLAGIDAHVLALAGCVGPFFPIMMTRMTRVYGTTWRSLTGSLYLGIQGTLLILHFVAGLAIDTLGVSAAFWLPAGLLVTSFLLLLAHFRRPGSTVL